eukprot:TRINITY_DN19984_c0_g2_i1.p1 TRINITY_DN19984_c0_g2~~TRINITY_DN19984_c0_g2_i1.p1  ORF type:complete len:395 (+),score=116.06 TRINITY_DN19984_c0_g2_i1:73-1185(+)
MAASPGKAKRARVDPPAAERLELCRPDDWHHHFRDGPALRDTVRHAAATFRRCIAMPNLVPPVVTAADMLAYRERLLAALPPSTPPGSFVPMMTLYLTDKTSPDEITKAWNTGYCRSVKLYPAGATTNSASGITNYTDCLPALRRMAELGMVLSVHGESTRPGVDVFDKEARFYEDVMGPQIVRALPNLKVVCEHITTREAVEFVQRAGPNVAATITPQHLLLNRNAIFQGGIRPHLYCLPILKREEDRAALVAAATSGSPKFFLGTDSAPHSRERKECACGCAGCFSAHAALPLYAEVFEAAGRLDRLEGFASHFGADFYGVPRSTERIALVREPWRVPDTYDFGDGVVVPLRAGEEVAWRVERAGRAG